MRLAVLLILLVTLMFTDATRPCQEQNNNGYDTFERRHILSYDFDRNSRDAWADYIRDKGLCGRSFQSFLEEDDENKVKRICNGRGIKDRGNLCISKEKFTVYIVQSTVRNNQCVVQSLENKERYVVVACDLVGNQCLPVHYQTQTTSRPSRNGEICQPRTNRPSYRKNRVVKASLLSRSRVEK